MAEKLWDTPENGWQTYLGTIESALETAPADSTLAGTQPRPRQEPTAYAKTVMANAPHERPDLASPLPERSLLTRLFGRSRHR